MMLESLFCGTTYCSEHPDSDFIKLSKSQYIFHKMMFKMSALIIA